MAGKLAACAHVDELPSLKKPPRVFEHSSRDNELLQFVVDPSYRKVSLSDLKAC